MRVKVINSQQISFEDKLNKVLDELNSLDLVVKDIKISTVISASGSIYCTGVIVYDCK